MAGELVKTGWRAPDGGNYIAGLSIGRVTAGWIVQRYDAMNNSTDMIAGAFDTPEKATEAARQILGRELYDLGKRLQAPVDVDAHSDGR